MCMTDTTSELLKGIRRNFVTLVKDFVFRLQKVIGFQNYKMNLRIMIDQFREFQLKRRQSHIIEKMNTFTNVDTQLGEHNQFFLATVVVTQGLCITICPNDPNSLEGRVIHGEHVKTYDDRPDSVVLNLFDFEERGDDDPLFIFTTPEEKRRFVVALRYFSNCSDPEGNNEQNQDQGSDSGKTSSSSGNSGEI